MILLIIVYIATFVMIDFANVDDKQRRYEKCLGNIQYYEALIEEYEDFNSNAIQL